MSAPTTISLPARLWSYELLGRADVRVPVYDEGDRVDLSRIGSVAIEHYSPEHGAGSVHMTAPSQRDLARWLFGLLVIAPGHFDRHPEHAVEARALFRSFVLADDLPRRSLLTYGQTTTAIRSRKDLAEKTRKHREHLQQALRIGLERRLGTLLGGDENTWIAFAAREIAVPGIRVCEQCSLVFKGRRTARRCRSCNRAPVLPKVRPVALGGWHVDVRVGGRWFTGEFERTVTYSAICQGCRRLFSDDDARSRYCGNCRSAAGRKRRQRESGATTGRREFAYVSAKDDGPLQSVGVAGPDGQTINLEAIGGVVRTTDLEFARQLDANFTLRRVNGWEGLRRTSEPSDASGLQDHQQDRGPTTTAATPTKHDGLR